MILEINGVKDDADAMRQQLEETVLDTVFRIWRADGVRMVPWVLVRFGGPKEQLFLSINHLFIRIEVRKLPASGCPRHVLRFLRS